MGALHRIFVAVPLADELKEAVEDVQQQLEAAGAALRWTKPSHMHFTLRFLGEIPLAQVARVRLATREAADGVRPFKLSLRGLGAFPSFQRPQVVWLGVEEGGKELEALARRLDEILTQQRFPAEPRPFRPHLTLARIRYTRSWGDLVRALAQFKEVAAGTQQVEGITVMESQLTPRGPIYTPVEEVRLSAYEK